MIYLYGTTHQIQNGSDYVEVEKYEKFLKYVIKTHEIDCIIEEWSKDATEQHQISETVTSRIASENKIKYTECDPSVQEYKELNLVVKPLTGNATSSVEAKKIQTENWIKSHKREYYWIDKINSMSYKNLLLVCGKGHLSEIDKKINQNMITNHLLDGIDIKLKKINLEFKILNHDIAKNL